MQYGAMALAGGLVFGCAPYRRIEPPPGATFAAHIVPGGFMVDRMRRDERGVLVTSAHWVRLHGEPTLTVRSGAERGEGIWVGGPGRAVVRTSEAPDAPLVGSVVPSWQDQAIRLTIAPASGAPISTGTFEREHDGLGPPELRRGIERDDELHGSYRAPLHAADGNVVGWLRVSVEDDRPYPLMYEGVLPPEVDEALAAAAAAALRDEIAWIDRHTLDSLPGMVDRP